MVKISAKASDTVGVTKVEFYVDGALIATDSTAPFTAAWIPKKRGTSYQLQAKAYDAAGNVGTSKTISVKSSKRRAPSLPKDLPFPLPSAFDKFPFPKK